MELRIEVWPKYQMKVPKYYGDLIYTCIDYIAIMVLF